jgi:Ca2+-binding EF-hand superfamily protein
MCWAQAAVKRLGLPPTNNYLTDLFKQYDIDKDGTVDYAEFRSYVLQKEASMQKAFRWALQSCKGIKIWHLCFFAD